MILFIDSDDTGYREERYGANYFRGSSSFFLFESFVCLAIFFSSVASFRCTFLHLQRQIAALAIHLFL